MRFVSPLRFAARSRLLGCIALLACAPGLVSAQAPVVQTEISADVLLALLGKGKAIEIGLPSEVRMVHVAVTRSDAVVDSQSTVVGERPDDQSASVVVSVGAVGPTLRCPLLTFIHAIVTRDDGSSRGGLSGMCVEASAPVSLVPSMMFLSASFEVGRWYAIEGFAPLDLSPRAQPATDGRASPDLDEFVFHVYLATDDAPAPFEEIDTPPRSRQQR